jgi:hypothetical protein
MAARRLGFLLAAALAICACARAGEGVARHASPIIYGADDRADYFDVTAPEWQSRIAASTVALIPRGWISRKDSGYQLTAPRWGDLAGLCPGTRFADQPAAALCTGVLVDWDLVLTADHCVRVLALDDLAVVFGYYYEAPSVLAIDGLGEIASILDEALDPEGASPRLDYAWLRLRAPAPPPHAPAQIYVRPPALAAGDPVVSISAGGGLPFKLAPGNVQDARVDSGDYFVADTDTFEGSSGGGAFDDQTALLGILARGGADFVPTAGNCNQPAEEPDGANAHEQFTYASRAVAALCAKNPAASVICRPDCPNPCLTGPRTAASSGGEGCAVAGNPGRTGSATFVVAAMVAGLVVMGRRSRRHTGSTHRLLRGEPPGSN